MRREGEWSETSYGCTLTLASSRRRSRSEVSLVNYERQRRNSHASIASYSSDDTSEVMQRVPSETSETRSPILGTTLTCSSLVRAIELRHIMKGFGRQLNVLVPANHDDAIPSLGFHVFLSHSWRASRILKFVAIAIYFNTTKALWLCALSICLCHVAHMLEFTKSMCSPFKTMSGQEYQVSLLNLFVGVFSLGWGLFFGHLLPGKSKHAFCFLDKCCIEQRNSFLLNEAVRNIGAFLDHSDRMLVLWDETYFSRLWCSFELATMMSLRPHSIDFISLPQAAHLVGSLVAATFGRVASRCLMVHQQRLATMLGMSLTDTTMAIVFLSTIPSTLVVYVCCYWTAATRIALERQLRNYSLRYANCSHESDRAIIENFVQVKWRTDAKNGIDSFDEYVRDRFYEQVLFQIGRVSAMPYLYLLLPNLSMSFHLSEIAPQAYRVSTIEFIRVLHMGVVVPFLVLPLLYFLIWNVSVKFYMWRDASPKATSRSQKPLRKSASDALVAILTSVFAVLPFQTAVKCCWEAHLSVLAFADLVLLWLAIWAFRGISAARVGHLRDLRKH